VICGYYIREQNHYKENTSSFFLNFDRVIISINAKVFAKNQLFYKNNAFFIVKFELNNLMHVTPYKSFTLLFNLKKF